MYIAIFSADDSHKANEMWYNRTAAGKEHTNMTISQYFSAFRLFHADTLLLAFGVTLAASLLKKTVLKNVPKRLFVFLPFVLGVAFFAAYRAVKTGGDMVFPDELSKIIEGGFASGCAATLYYNIYEQFIRKKTTVPSVSPLLPVLEPLVAEGKAEEIANALYEGAKDLSDDALTAYLTQRLTEYCTAELTGIERKAYVKILGELIVSLRNK